MINGAHLILFSTSPDEDRAFLRDVFELPHVDAGEGWLIFGLPPSELAVHPAETTENASSAGLYLMTPNVEELVDELTERGIEVGAVQDQGWGLVTEITLPGGGALKIYQPQHPRPESASAPKAKTPARKNKSAKKAPKPALVVQKAVQKVAKKAVKKVAQALAPKRGQKAAPKKKAGRRS
jgi:hypothetical protein